MATYRVQDDGKAQSGLKAGDEVVTAAGTYRVTGVNADGSYQSERVSNTNTSTYTGTYANSSSTAGSSRPNNTTGNYTPLGTYHDAGLSPAVRAQIENLQTQYAAAQAAGNRDLMNQLHDNAEAIRAQYGYSGGTDGSDYIGLLQPVQAPSWSYGAAKPTYTSNYQSNIDALINQILNREDFAYDAETDPLYQQYVALYNREGDRAMNDTLAAAAAHAGGMNSYAVTAAQQANDYYAAQLADQIPELYQLAYSMYLDDIDQQVRDLGLLQAMDDTQYARYRDTMSDWYNDRDFAYGVYRDDVADSQWDQSFDYTVGRDEVSDSRYERETAYGRALDFLNAGIMPSNTVLEAAGISRDEATKILAAQQPGGGDGNDPVQDDGGYDNGNLTEEQVRTLQRKLGVTVNGKYGRETQTAAGGLDADTAYVNLIGYGESGGGSEHLTAMRFSTYENARDYMEKMGVPMQVADELMDEHQWSLRKEIYEAGGQERAEVADNATYADYLTDYVNYALVENGIIEEGDL